MNPESNELVRRIRNEIPVAEVVSESLPLVHRDQHAVGFCPWHLDTQAALQVAGSENRWTCWVCGQSGGSIEFVMADRQIDFDSAVSVLAERLPPG